MLERLAQASFGQVILVFGRLQLGHLLAHKGIAAEQRAGAKVQSQRIDHKLLGEDHAQIGRLAHALAQTGREVAPVDDRIEHLAGMCRVGWRGVFSLGAELLLVIGARVVGVLAGVGAHAGDGGIDGQKGIHVARLAQVGIGQVDALLQGHGGNGGIRVVVGRRKAAVDIKLAHQLVEVVVRPVGRNIGAEMHVAFQQVTRLRFQRFIIGVEKRTGRGQAAVVHGGQAVAGGAAHGGQIAAQPKVARTKVAQVAAATCGLRNTHQQDQRQRQNQRLAKDPAQLLLVKSFSH